MHSGDKFGGTFEVSNRTFTVGVGTSFQSPKHLSLRVSLPCTASKIDATLTIDRYRSAAWFKFARERQEKHR